MNKANLTINLPHGKTVTFSESFLVYRDEEVFYKDISSIAYLWTITKHTIYFIPAGTSNEYYMNIKTPQTSLHIDFKSAWLSSKKSEQERQEAFLKLHYILENLIKPFVLINLLLEYAEKDKLEIGPLAITPEGLYKKRFWRDPELLPWGLYYNSVLLEGNVHIYKQKGKEDYKKFSSYAMATDNVVMLPGVLSFLFQKSGKLDKQTIKELRARKAELSSVEKKERGTPEKGKEFCTSCGEKIEAPSQSFCSKCGSRIR